MQKLLTVAIDIEMLKKEANGPFTITDVAGINTLLHEGWMIQEWEFITADDEAETPVLMLILNDEMPDSEFDITTFSEEKDPEEDEDESDDDVDEIFENDKDKENDFENEEEESENQTVRSGYNQY